MFVGKRMQKNPVSLKRDQTLLDASNLIKKHRVRHLPVVDDKNHLVGIVTDRDVKKASASDATSLDIHELLYIMKKVSVEDVMTRNVTSDTPDMPLEKAAKLLHDNHFGCLPVEENGELTGIITTGDVLQFIMDAMDVESDSTRVELELEDKQGQLAKVLAEIADHGYKVRSVITSPERDGNTRICTLHLECDDDYELRKTLEATGFKIISFFHQHPEP